MSCIASIVCCDLTHAHTVTRQRRHAASTSWRRSFFSNYYDTVIHMTCTVFLVLSPVTCPPACPVLRSDVCVLHKPVTPFTCATRSGWEPGAHQARGAAGRLCQRDGRLHCHRSGHEWLLRFHCESFARCGLSHARHTSSLVCHSRPLRSKSWGKKAAMLARLLVCT